MSSVASLPKQDIAIVNYIGKQCQISPAPAPAVEDMVDGFHSPLEFDDRVAPAGLVLSSRGDIHGVGAAGHKAAAAEHLFRDTS